LAADRRVSAHVHRPRRGWLVLRATGSLLGLFVALGLGMLTYGVLVTGAVRSAPVRALRRRVPFKRRTLCVSHRLHEPVANLRRVARRLRDRSGDRSARRSATVRALERRLAPSVRIQRYPAPSRCARSRAARDLDEIAALRAGGRLTAVISYTALSITTRVRFAGATIAIVARQPRFISSEPSPSIPITRRCGCASATPSAIGNASPMLPSM